LGDDKNIWLFNLMIENFQSHIAATKLSNKKNLVAQFSDRKLG
jgi:hypothetical protein